MAISAKTASDLAAASLVFYMRGVGKSQTTMDKPLLAWLQQNKQTFPGGGGQSKLLSIPVQGAFMSDNAGFLQGIEGDETLSFTTNPAFTRSEWAWYEVHAGFFINWTELKIDGITIVDDKKGGSVSDHADTATRITPILEQRLENFGESLMRAKNEMFWKDGSQDGQQVPGITSFLDEDPTTGTKGGIVRSTYAWWRHRVGLGKVPSAANSTLIKFLNSELIQLRKFGGKPNKALCGSSFLDALRDELVAKGYFTQEGFAGEKATDLGIGGLHISGMGKFEYDPTLDQLGKAKYCYIMDGRHIKLRPMVGEDDKVLNPERPYDQLVFIKSVTWTGALVCDQMNAHGVYSIA